MKGLDTEGLGEPPSRPAESIRIPVVAGGIERGEIRLLAPIEDETVDALSQLVTWLRATSRPKNPTGATPAASWRK